VGFRGVAILSIALVCIAIPLHAQIQSPSDTLVLTGKSAATWIDAQAKNTTVVVLKGPATIKFDRAILSADNAVMWLSTGAGGDPKIVDIEIALLGRTKVERLEGEQVISTLTGGQRLVHAQARSENIKVAADPRVAKDLSKTDLYRQAEALRQEQTPTALAAVSPGLPATRAAAPGGARRARRPTSAPTTAPAAAQAPVVFEAVHFQTTKTDEGNVAIVLNDGVKLVQIRPNGDLIEMIADRAVLFTPLKSLHELTVSGGKKQGREIINSAYLEGDVKIDYVAARPKTPEQRLTADRVYYEFATDRAVLTSAIVHTIDPTRGTPMVVQAQLMRQLSQGEFRASHMQLTSSTFAVPSLSLAADEIYVRTEPTGDPDLGDRVVYEATNTSFRAFDVPFFFLPYQSGSMEKGGALRTITVGHLSNFGTAFETDWGLFETLGKLPPRDLDVSYRLDYFSERGPAGGINAAYGAGALTDTTKQATDFTGDLKSYFVYDHGYDDVGRIPIRLNHPDELRGQALWEHQHFFPDDWQAQVRAGWVSDATFMEQWFRHDFQDGPPRDLMAYIKHQEDTEAFTFGATYQPYHLVTTSNQVQEQFEVDRLPEVGYYREGDSILGDHATLFSENVGGGLHFSRSRATLAEQGFGAAPIVPGLPAEGYTGLTKTIVWRGDFRQEVDLPLAMGPLKVVPYVMGRYTQYSDSPQESERARGMAGAGARVTTELWKTDPTAESDFLDIHQLRHVIEPELNFFSSAMNVQRNQVFVYDPQVDAINDLTVGEIGLHQRWQTKRGGPGQWRSVDAFTLDVDAEYFGNKPPKTFRQPYDFRGQFFSAYPEESLPRDAVNASASWRLSDNTVLLGDTSFNLDRTNLQTLGIGLLVRRDTRLSYYVSNRYIADLNSNITGIHADYQISPKYTVSIDQQFDFTQGQNVYSSAAILRQFDTFVIAFRYFNDETSNQSGVTFNIYPTALGMGMDTSQFQTFHR